MLTKTIILLVSALCVNCAVRVVREENVVDMFKDDVTKAVEKVKDIGDHIGKMLGLETNPFSGDTVNLIKNQVKNFADQAEQVQKQLEEELKQISTSSVADGFTEISKKIQETVSTFRQQIESSDVTQKATELQGKFQDGINNLLEESKKVASTLETQATDAGKDLENLTRKVIDTAVENLTQLQDKLHTSTGHSHN